MKKTFTDNPAMNFITAPVEEQLQDPTPKEIAETIAAGIPAGCKINPIFVEKRTQRANFVFAPSLFKLAKQRAKDKGMSLNEYINNLVELDLYRE